MRWSIVNKTWREFQEDERCRAGALLELEGGSRIVIGDINVAGGVCNDCRGIADEDVILRMLDLTGKENTK